LLDVLSRVFPLAKHDNFQTFIEQLKSILKPFEPKQLKELSRLIKQGFNRFKKERLLQ